MLPSLTAVAAFFAATIVSNKETNTYGLGIQGSCLFNPSTFFFLG